MQIPNEITSGLDGLVRLGSESNFVIEILDDYGDENYCDLKIQTLRIFLSEVFY